MFTTTAPLFGAIPGGPEMLIILLVLVLLFGAQKIPKLARSTGQAMGEFKKGREEVEDELQQMQEETVGDLNEDDDLGSNTTGTGPGVETTSTDTTDAEPTGTSTNTDTTDAVETESETERNAN